MSSPAVPTALAPNFNRKERRKAGKKLLNHFKRRTPNGHSGVNARVNWRARKSERRERREAEFLETVKESSEANGNGLHSSSGTSWTVPPSEPKFSKQDTWYSLSVALPGSILNNTQSPELRAYVAGQIARTCAIFCVDEVIVFDESARMKRRERKAYKDGSWLGRERPSEENVECNFHMARILQYLECPQYLRKAFFPIQAPLKFAGLLNPLDCPHHLRSNERSIPYREGLVLDRLAKEGRGPVCDIGLDKELQLHIPPSIPSEDLPVGTRVTVKIEPSEPEAKRFRGTMTTREEVRRTAGIYWGYSVRIARSLSDVLSEQYDIIIGTSERGTPIEELCIEKREECRILIIFGGLKGLEAAIEADSSIAAKDVQEYFENYVNALSDQGSRTIRTEEAIPITLTALKSRLNGL